MHVSKNCMSCKSTDLHTLVDLGQQPISNKYKKRTGEKDERFPILLAQCQDCALIQLTHLPGLENVKITYPWISYKEAEEHLDDVSNHLSSILKNSQQNILGLSFKDTTLVERLGAKNHTSRTLSMERDLGLGKNNLELISQMLPNKMHSISSTYGLADCIIARHVLEHTYDMKEFLQKLTGLIKPGGHLVLEVPDFEKSLKNLDYPAIWEEHSAYFTENTFKSFLEMQNFELVFFKNYEYLMENSLVAIIKQKENKSSHELNYVKEEVELGNEFAKSFDDIKSKVRSLLSHKKDKSVCLMGAGHLGCAFINYFDVADKMAYVIDDDPNKKGLFMPGTDLEIVDSSILKNPSIQTCLLSINPRNLGGFFSKFEKYTTDGGQFYSIFKNSAVPLPVFLNAEDLGLVKKSEESYFTSSSTGISVLSNTHIDFLKANLYKSRTGRTRICTHTGPQDQMHEMIILFAGGNQVLPHAHLEKSESFHVIEGQVQIVFFDEKGKPSNEITLSDKNNFYYRLNKPAVYHAVLVKSPWLVLHETTNGPFKQDSSIFPEWAPKDGGSESKSYFNELELRLKKEK
jgi:cupin fold WbuC family metalloprotein